jgi:hypothetical protein
MGPKEPATGPFTEPVESIQNLTPFFFFKFQIQFILLPSTPRYLKWFLYFGISD